MAGGPAVSDFTITAQAKNSTVLKIAFVWACFFSYWRLTVVWQNMTQEGQFIVIYSWILYLSGHHCIAAKIKLALTFFQGHPCTRNEGATD